MEPMFSNATVLWTEREIVERDALVQQLYQIIKDAWIDMNPAIRFIRVETPIITPAEFLLSHIDEKFPMLETDRGFLRPETTAGCIQALYHLYPQKTQLQKRLPICIWQVGKSFRDETNPQTMRASKLRLIEFYQQEFQLFTGESTKADYLHPALDALTKRFGGEIITPTEIPHYSALTLDWEIDGLEVAGCSKRLDFAEGILFEVSIGLDRLLTKVLKH